MQFFYPDKYQYTKKLHVSDAKEGDYICRIRVRGEVDKFGGNVYTLVANGSISLAPIRRFYCILIIISLIQILINYY